MGYILPNRKRKGMKNNKINVIDYLLQLIEKIYYILLLAILLLTIFNLFHYLKDTPIYSWDEARHGINAYEMLKKHEFVVNTYGYKNDYWNLKPPISYYGIILGYCIAGFNPLGLRLYSAISALLTILIVSLFVKYKHGRIASLISVLVLSTTPKYIVIHCARTGDADSLFILFFTMSIIALILSEKNVRWLYISGISFSLAFLTKSWHAANIAIVIGVYLVLSGRLFKLKVREFVFFILSTSVLILVWGILRYKSDGMTFFNMMINYDLLSRSSKALEGHIGDSHYYFYILKDFYSYWLGLMIGSFIACIVLYSKKIFTIVKVRKNYILAMILWVAVPLITFSSAKTKIPWYIFPMYPPIAIYIGVFCSVLLKGANRNILLQLLIIICIFMSAQSYEKVINAHIERFRNDRTRMTLNNVKLFTNIKDRNSYVDYGPNSSKPENRKKIWGNNESGQNDWKQSDLLYAELNWNITPLNGGMKKFLIDKNNRNIIVILKDKELKRLIKRYNLKILGEGDEVYILSK